MRFLRSLTDSIQGEFLERPNRFLVVCAVNGKRTHAFLPNPGRLEELLVPGNILYLERTQPSPSRKYRYTVVAAERDGHPIMLHTHRTNHVAQYLIEKGLIPGLEGVRIKKTEISVGRNRFDFLLEDKGWDIYLEVKSCTLVGRYTAMFPDAVTERGTRHIEGLAEVAIKGTRGAILFIVHWPFVQYFMPDYHRDMTFTRALLKHRNTIQIIPIAITWRHDLSLSDSVKILDIPWSYIEQESQDRGSYMLILYLQRDAHIPIGSLGRIHFKKGFYVYVGSAMANLSKRIERHRRVSKRIHWHIDYLLTRAHLIHNLAIRSSEHLECEIARRLSDITEWSIPHFGSSDCSCGSHLFGMVSDPIHSRPFQEMVQYFRMDRTFLSS